MTTFEVPTITTARLRLRAFRASDLDAYSAMQANPEVMRYMVRGRTAMPAEVWWTMLMSLGFMGPARVRHVGLRESRG
jgi:RimJ/RimL family protein N-acetyltransferase